MSVKGNLWSLTLLPGEKYPLYVRHDFQLTNVALGEELRDANGRSVVKVTHHPLPPIDDSDSEDEFDSEFEDELEDEFELDSEEEAEAANATKPKANGKMEVEGDDEDEDENEDGDEEESDDDFDDDDEVEETTVIVSLTAGRTEHAKVDLTFSQGSAVMFETTGENAVHLLGNYILQPEYDSDSEYDSDFDDEHDDYSDLIGSDEDEELDSEEESALIGKPKAKIEEISETAAKPKAVPAAEAPKAKVKDVKTEVKSEIKSDKSAPKRKADEIESPAGKTAAAGGESTEGLSKAQKKKLAKKAKLEGAAPAAPAKEAVKAPGPQKKTLPSGLIIEDVKIGDGPVAKVGKRLGMRYIGKLENGKQFDANTAGKPFTFALGRGEVIQGWDQGLVGMAVGGERRLTIPASLAYGSQKIPGIPKNSTLKFDVKLVSVS